MSDQHDGQAAGMARLLGWFSIALGAAQLAVPDGLSRVIGVQPTQSTRTLMRAMGLRELVAGFGILANRAPGWLWARVAGDTLDLALLANVLTSESEKARAGAATAAVAGVTSLDILAATRRRRSGGSVAA